MFRIRVQTAQATCALPGAPFAKQTLAPASLLHTSPTESARKPVVVPVAYAA